MTGDGKSFEATSLWSVVLFNPVKSMTAGCRKSLSGCDAGASAEGDPLIVELSEGIRKHYHTILTEKCSNHMK